MSKLSSLTTLIVRVVFSKELALSIAGINAEENKAPFPFFMEKPSYLGRNFPHCFGRTNNQNNCNDL